MNLRFWTLWKPAPKVFEIVRRSSLKIRLSDWRSDQNLVNNAARIVGSEDFQCMLDVLRNENPANLHLPMGCSTKIRATHQAQTEGYNMAIANLEAMARIATVPETIVPTFEPEEIGTQTA